MADAQVCKPPVPRGPASAPAAGGDRRKALAE